MGFYFPLMNSLYRVFLAARWLCVNSGTSGSWHLKAPSCSGFPSYYKYGQRKGKESMKKAPLFFTGRPGSDTHHLDSPSFGEDHSQGPSSVQRGLRNGQPLPSDDSTLWNRLAPCLRSCKILSAHISDVCFHLQNIPSQHPDIQSYWPRLWCHKREQSRETLVYNGFSNQHVHSIPSTLCH